MPREGIRKPPETPENPRVESRLKEAGSSVGIVFTGKCDAYPNTLQAHALVEYTLKWHGWQKQNEMQELIFKGYFTDGIYPGTVNLVKLAGSCGLDKSAVKKYITDAPTLEAVREKARDASRKGVSGVPMFYMNGQPLFSGAQDKSCFVNMFQVIAEKYPYAGRTSQEKST